ncbi:MAG: peptidoglycan editing factor PgeF [Selenomonadaceae bacterium]|nr:peptidoglycan editing factor PgeF [Selenomonadaceae bacterium]
MSYFLEHKEKNIWQGKFSIFPEDLVIHAISTRLGGVSKKPYSALNLAFHVGDDISAVRDNRQIFAHSLLLNAKDIVSPKQIHSANVLRVTKEHKGLGAKDYESAVEGTDALITNEANVPLLLCFADCTPILFVDPKNKAVGIAHAGWKGTAGKIAEKTLFAMKENFRTNPKTCLIGIGPSISKEFYEVGDDVAKIFQDEFSYSDKFLTQTDGKYKLDLWEANRQILLKAGALAANIDVAGACTYGENSWYYSYRKENGTTGRIGAIIALKDLGD